MPKQRSCLWETCQGDPFLGSWCLTLRAFTFFTRTSARFTMSGTSTSNVAKLPCFGEPKVRFGETYYIPCPSRRVPICLTGVVMRAGFEPAPPAESLLMFRPFCCRRSLVRLTTSSYIRAVREKRSETYCRTQYREPRCQFQARCYTQAEPL